jgi:hypothetical protein
MPWYKTYALGYVAASVWSFFSIGAIGLSIIFANEARHERKEKLARCFWDYRRTRIY